MNDIQKVADEADMIISGYAFTRTGDKIRVLNLNNTSRAAVLTIDGEVLEASMPDIELTIVTRYYVENREFMEVQGAEILSV
ncbi:MAG: hypothetical protein LUC95_08015 [Lachnospiraceae bacterium]|nr:hypothetical protein [Lachnospiraceae bacterium]MCD8380242.1 hypothetical protein [Lachnospiraceae bacterium]